MKYVSRISEILFQKSHFEKIILKVSFWKSYYENSEKLDVENF